MNTSFDVLSSIKVNHIYGIVRIYFSYRFVYTINFIVFTETVKVMEKKIIVKIVKSYN